MSIRTLMTVLLVFLINSLSHSFVNNVGDFNYSFPIEIPKGTNNFSPDISISYNSSASNGFVGIGWSLNCFSVIKRDPDYGISFTKDDHFLYEGQTLFLNKIDNSYFTKFEKYEKINSYYLDSDSSYWIVVDQNGTKYHYGKNSNSRIVAVGTEGRVRAWALSKVEDVHGNYYKIEYEQDMINGDYYPIKIIYTCNDINPLLKYRTVLFSYEERYDHVTKYLPTQIDLDKRLKWISVLVNADENGNCGNLLRKYRLDYESEEKVNLSRLERITEYGNDGDIPNCPWVTEGYNGYGSTLPSTEFKWTLPYGGLFKNMYEDYFSSYYNEYGHVIGYGDIDGDGCKDILLSGSGKEKRVSVRLSRSVIRGPMRAPAHPSVTELDPVTPWGEKPVSVLLLKDSEFEKKKAIGFLDYDGDSKSEILVEVDTYKNHEYYTTKRKLVKRAGRGSPPVYETVKVKKVEKKFVKREWYIHDKLLTGMEKNSYKIITGKKSMVFKSAIDFNHDGRDDILTTDNRIVISKGENISATMSGFDSNAKCVGDFNGDNRLDALYVKDITKIITSTRKVKLPGRQTRYKTVTTGKEVITGRNWNFKLSFGDTYQKTMTMFTSDPEYQYQGLIDINGDGCKDVIFKKKHNNKIEFHIHKFAYDKLISSGKSFEIGEEANIKSFFPIDINNDGMEDLIINYVINSSPHTRVLISDGNKLIYSTEFKIYPLSKDERIADIIDFNNDNKLDLVVEKENGERTKVRLSISNRFINNKLYQIYNSSGSKIDISYNSYNDWHRYVSTHNNEYPYVTVSPSKFIVCNIKFDDGLENTFNKSYNYKDYKMYYEDIANSKSLGFKYVNEKDGSTGITTNIEYSQNKNLGGVIIGKERVDNKGTLFEKEKITYKTNEKNIGGEEVLNNVIYSEEFVKYGTEGDSIKQKIEYLTYDNNGFCTTIKNYGNVDIAGDESLIEKEYFKYPNTNNVVLKRSSKKTFNLNGEWVITNEEKRYFNDFGDNLGKGNLEKIEYINGSESITESYQYDPYGNCISYKDPNYNDMGLNENTIEYYFDDDYKTLLVEEFKPNYMTTNYSYDNLLRMNEIITPNHNTKRFVYDEFNNVTKVINPMDSEYSPTIQYVYDYSSKDIPRVTKITNKYSRDGFLSTYKYFDGYGRLVFNVNSPQNDTMLFVAQSFKYNDDGKLSKKSSFYSFPCLDPVTLFDNRNFTDGESYYYDNHARVKEIINPGNVSTRYEYGLNSIRTINGNNSVNEREVKGNEKIVSSFTGKYPNHKLYGSTKIKYAADGIIVSDPKGNETKCILDMLGRVVSVKDPNKGNVTYTYDCNGNVIQKVDNKNNTIHYEYDLFNRLTKIDYAADDDVYNYYDEAGHGNSIGRITRQVYGLGERTYNYDALGRVIISTNKIDNKIRVAKYEYDNFNNVTSLVYPDGEIVNFNYDNYGHLSKIAGENVYVDKITYNRFSQINDITYGNSLRHSFDYYTDNYIGDLLSQSKSFRLKKRTIYDNLVPQEETYLYDNLGNLTDISNINDINKNESFQYDELNRLISAKSSFYGDKTYKYDNLNNIIFKDNKTFYYDGNSFKVLNDGIYNYSYDLNGNIISKQGIDKNISIEYDEEDRVKRLTDVSDVFDYSYGPWFERVKKEENGVSTYYFFPFYNEIDKVGEVDTVKFYGEYAQRDKKNGLIFKINNFQGSTSKIYNDSGSMVEENMYDPFGKLLGSSYQKSHKLFSGKEMDDHGYYYFSARFYDPDLGRFINPDPIKDGINHYAYCGNDPINRLDLTGLGWYAQNKIGNSNSTPSVPKNTGGFNPGVHGWGNSNNGSGSSSSSSSSSSSTKSVSTTKTVSNDHQNASSSSENKKQEKHCRKNMQKARSSFSLDVEKRNKKFKRTKWKVKKLSYNLNFEFFAFRRNLSGDGIDGWDGKIFNKDAVGFMNTETNEVYYVEYQTTTENSTGFDFGLSVRISLENFVSYQESEADIGDIVESFSGYLYDNEKKGFIMTSMIPYNNDKSLVHISTPENKYVKVRKLTVEPVFKGVKL